MAWYWTALLILVFLGAFIFLVWWIRDLFRGKDIGESCSLHTDCDGWGPGPNDVACCQGVCTRKKADWAGIGYCPADCRGCPGCPLGSCGPPYGPGVGVGGVDVWHWPREQDEPCVVHTDCEGWGPGTTAAACCGGVCKKKQADWAGVGYCPAECRGCAGCPLGTCGPWHTPRSQGEPCALDPDCAGWSLFGNVACCNFRCVTKDRTIQTCPDFCSNHPDVCNAPYPRN